MSTTNINDIVISLARLQTNYTNLMNSWYDVFYNTTAQDISLQLYDTAGTLTTKTIPNRAKDFNYIKNGSGTPEGVISASVGCIYQDLANGTIYSKYSGTGNTGWTPLAKLSDIDVNYLNKGLGSPEGILISSIGAIYIDNSTGDLYIKRTSGGNTGWYLYAGEETKTSLQTKLGVTSSNIASLVNLSGNNSGDETSSTIISKLGYTPANDSLVMHTTGTESISGGKTFNNNLTAASINIGNLSYATVLSPLKIQSISTSHNELIIQNTGTGTASSSDIIVNNNLSTETTYYGDFGMNSSYWNGTGALNTANTVYLTSTNGDLAIGTTTSNSIHFVVAGSSTDSATIDTLGNFICTGSATAAQFKLSALNTAPTSSGATGTLGEIRLTSSAIYLCTATNTWVKATLATW